MIADSSVLLVKAIHNFKGTNNDELCLKKGDVITVTQAIDGGWWEGTLNGVTGWFPSNYVKELKSDSLKVGKGNCQLSDVPQSPNLNNSRMYRNIVFQDIIQTESKHLAELHLLIAKYLNPLKESGILTEVEFSYLANNLKDVCACSRALINMLEDVKSASPKAQRIGGVFLQLAPLLEKILSKYCSDHPKAVSVIEKHKDILEKFMEDHGANPPGVLTLTTGLSKPFRRLEKYPALLQELQRHTQENHVDRGDTQRAASVYKDIASACSNIRRQKEMEIEILTGNIKDWEGEAIQTLGNIVHMGSVIFLTEDQQKRDRYLVMFPETLVILSISARMSSFVYEGKLPLSGISIRQIDASEGHQYAFEITGNLIQRIIVICASSESLNQWLNFLQNSNVKSSHSSSNVTPRNSTLNRISPTHSSFTKPSSSISNSLPPSPQNLTQEDKSINQNRIAVAAKQVTKKVWPNWNLRPHPPLKANFTPKNEVKLRRSNSCKKERDQEFGEDKPFHVLEAYGSYDRVRNTVPSATASAPPRLNFEEDKIFVEDMDGDGTEVKEKTLVDTVYMLKDQVQELKLEISSLKKSLNEEKQARKQLEIIIKKHFLLGEENRILTSLEG